MPPRVVAWDFDGVLNRDVADGRSLWAEGFEARTGHPLAPFQVAIFGDGFAEVMTGRADLRDRVADWAARVGYAPGADALMADWFARDVRPDPVTGALLDALAAAGVRQVIATNNDARRARYIEAEMGYGARVEAVFASGRMGVAKPDPRFFARIARDLDAAPAEIVLIDDLAANVAAARRAGWRAVHLTEGARLALGAALARMGLPCAPGLPPVATCPR